MLLQTHQTVHVFHLYMVVQIHQHLTTMHPLILTRWVRKTQVTHAFHLFMVVQIHRHLTTMHPLTLIKWVRKTQVTHAFHLFMAVWMILCGTITLVLIHLIIYVFHLLMAVWILQHLIMIQRPTPIRWAKQTHRIHVRIMYMDVWTRMHVIIMILPTLQMVHVHILCQVVALV